MNSKCICSKINNVFIFCLLEYQTFAYSSFLNVSIFGISWFISPLLTTELSLLAAENTIKVALRYFTYGVGLDHTTKSELLRK